jgi:hypothetical protein
MNDSDNARSTTRRHGLPLSLTIAALLSCTTSCSGTDPDGGGDGGDGLDQTGACRRFATRYTESFGSDPRTWTCAFDRSLLEMTCGSQIPGFEPISRTTLWDTIAAAVSDDRPFGKRTRKLETFAYSDCIYSRDHTYDAGGRLAAIAASTAGDMSCSISNVAYDAWDGTGRPTHGIQNGVGASDCTGQDLSLSYDETTRTVSYTSSGGTNCLDLAESVTFDEDGNVIRATVLTSVTTYTIEARGQICPD